MNASINTLPTITIETIQALIAEMILAGQTVKSVNVVNVPTPETIKKNAIVTAPYNPKAVLFNLTEEEVKVPLVLVKGDKDLHTYCGKCSVNGQPRAFVTAKDGSMCNGCKCDLSGQKNVFWGFRYNIATLKAGYTVKVVTSMSGTPEPIKTAPAVATLIVPSKEEQKLMAEIARIKAENDTLKAAKSVKVAPVKPVMDVATKCAKARAAHSAKAATRKLEAAKALLLAAGWSA